MSAFVVAIGGVKRTCRCAAHISAYDPKRTLAGSFLVLRDFACCLALLRQYGRIDEIVLVDVADVLNRLLSDDGRCAILDVAEPDIWIEAILSRLFPEFLQVSWTCVVRRQHQPHFLALWYRGVVQ